MKFHSTKARVPLVTAREGLLPLTRAAFRLLLSFRVDITFARMSKSARDVQTIQNPVKRYSELQKIDNRVQKTRSLLT